MSAATPPDAASGVRTPSGAAWRAAACVAAAAATWTLVPAEGPPREGLALFVLIGALWVTQALHLTVTALLVPVAIGLAGTLGLSPAQSAATIAIASSCGFMLPMGTPPNALVYGTGQVPMATMMRCGLVLNLLCVAVMFGSARLAG